MANEQTYNEIPVPQDMRTLTWRGHYATRTAFKITSLATLVFFLTTQFDSQGVLRSAAYAQQTPAQTTQAQTTSAYEKPALEEEQTKTTTYLPSQELPTVLSTSSAELQKTTETEEEQKQKASAEKEQEETFTDDEGITHKRQKY